MSTTIGLRFTFGQYHATPWGRHPNEGQVDWPPSPWRLLRALYATWKCRLPELSDEVVTGLLRELAVPPVYYLPPALRTHTRHWLPTSRHRSDAKGYDKGLALDAFMALHPQDEMLVSWGVDLDEPATEALGALLHELTWLGRAESAVQARRLDSEAVPDDWETSAPIEDGDLAVEPARLLAPQLPLDLEALTVTTAAVQKQRLSTPPGTRWLNYAASQVEASPVAAARRPPRRRVQAVRWHLSGPALPSVHSAVAYGHFLRSELLHRFGRLTDGRHSPVLTGCDVQGQPRDGHRHAHYLALDEDGDGLIETLVLWAPEGLDDDELRTATALTSLKPQGWLRDFRPVRLGLEYVGEAMHASPLLTGPARRWESATPFAPSHHAKRHQRDGPAWQAFVDAQVRRELGFRGLPDPSQVELVVGPPWLQFRRHRPSQTLRQARRAVGVRLHFTEAVAGPISLGALSHFGLGLFQPSARHADRP